MPPVIESSPFTPDGTRSTTAIITHVEGSVDPRSETVLKATVDNVIRLTGREIIVEGMQATSPAKMSYNITGKGMEVI